jgi:hypothetical protein
MVESHRTRGDYRVVGFKTHRVIATYGDLGDVRPVIDIALLLAVPSHSDHGAVILKSHRVPAACGDLSDRSILIPITAYHSGN